MALLDLRLLCLVIAITAASRASPMEPRAVRGKPYVCIFPNKSESEILT